MSHQDDAAAMAFAVLRNRSYRFLAISPDGVVVSNSSPGLPIDVSRPVVRPLEKPKMVRKHRRHYLRSVPRSAFLKATGYKDIMLAMGPGDEHVFPYAAGYSTGACITNLTNAAARLMGKGNYSVSKKHDGVLVVKKS